MKITMNYSHLILLFLFLPLSIFGAKDYEKRIEKQYDIAATGSTVINNRYGKVEVKNWEEDKVKIIVTIKVNATNKEEAERVFDRIHIHFTNSPMKVSAVTEIEAPSRTSWWSFYIVSKQNYSINYTVYMPEKNNLNLTNKYGNIYVEKVLGESTIELGYGSGKIQALGGKSNIVLAYGGLDIHTASIANLDIKYSNLSIGQIETLNLESKYSNISIDKIDRMLSNSKYDSFKIQSSQTFQLFSQYSNLKVDDLTKEIKLDLKYGSARIQLAPSFERVQIIGSYADFAVKASKEIPFNLELESKYASIRYPNAFQTQTLIEKDRQKSIKGHYGSKESSVIKVQLNYGGFTILE
jgi:hypothetical protein